ncbi:SURF1 family protein [Pseudoprimorskyibacter insulae]|uniref:SURF1-like protein n=1 Tax=Pseudoprimorskyibacter insulae TaxID=1695997 RepID=A0A2R8AY62_9RHOB|nr:SURF1 family protein [Pseudoprimorskyibacter insulae]SPF80973.1 hypothetical protein PRI8871_02787 [Pseudoprimorskyibacter insulae]
MKRIIATILFGLLGTAVLISLGVWQVQRLAWKQGVLSEIDATINGAPIPLPQSPTPEANRYAPVALSGQILPGEVFVLVSTRDQGAGYRVIAPFETGGRRILLDRGYIRLEAKDSARQIGASTVSANLHWPDDRNSSTPVNDIAANIWFARDLTDLAATLGTEPVLIVARSETPSDPGILPIPVDPSNIRNDHLSYAIQWFLLAVVWILMFGAFIWRMRKPKEA